ncbi:MAG: hypothetical protein K0R18_328 [Bacillales bacterium]|jgi:hypothetical protein|nr:hypothetical protein [Bacillales bacterium]
MENQENQDWKKDLPENITEMMTQEFWIEWVDSASQDYRSLSSFINAYTNNSHGLHYGMDSYIENKLGEFEDDFSQEVRDLAEAEIDAAREKAMEYFKSAF